MARSAICVCCTDVAGPPRQADLLLAQALRRQLLSLVEDQTALQVQQAQ